MSNAFKCDTCGTYFDNKDHMEIRPKDNTKVFIQLHSIKEYCDRCLVMVIKKEFGMHD